MKKLCSIVAFVALSTTAFSQVANINYGSVAALGGALFQGSDGSSADSISIGYFTGSANAALTGWVSIQQDTSFNTSTGFNTGAGTNFDVSSAIGLDAWILVADGSESGLIRGNDWATISGATAPTPTPTLAYQFGDSYSSSNVTILGDIAVTNNAGQGGTGISVSVVPEPSTYAMLAGALALGYVMVRRRKA